MKMLSACIRDIKACIFVKISIFIIIIIIELLYES
jgi:hypothetical protein